MVGFFYVYNMFYGFLCMMIVGDMLDNSNGINWDFVWLYCYINGNLMLMLGIGVEWNSDNQNEYYYGVFWYELCCSGMCSYDLDSSWNLYLELLVNYCFFGDWSVYGVVCYMCLLDEIIDSLMVDKFWSGLIFIGIIYIF